MEGSRSYQVGKQEQYVLRLKFYTFSGDSGRNHASTPSIVVTKQRFKVALVEFQ